MATMLDKYDKPSTTSSYQSPVPSHKTSGDPLPDNIGANCTAVIYKISFSTKCNGDNASNLSLVTAGDTSPADYRVASSSTSWPTRQTITTENPVQ